MIFVSLHVTLQILFFSVRFGHGIECSSGRPLSGELTTGERAITAKITRERGNLKQDNHEESTKLTTKKTNSERKNTGAQAVTNDLNG